VWLIRKVQKYGPHRVRVLGRTYDISENVFNPKYYYTSVFMAKHIKIAPDDIVLDMGTGSGIQAITAGRAASKVIAVDINPEAVQYAGENVKNNGMENVITVIEGDLFSPLNPLREFSVILFTPPYLQGTPKTDFDNALYDSNKELMSRFFREAEEYLKPGGYIQMIYSSIAGLEQALSISGQWGWNHRIVAREKTFTEEFIIFKLTMR
jgi:release factor glutamine methyltransferase